MALARAGFRPLIHNDHHDDERPDIESRSVVCLSGRTSAERHRPKSSQDFMKT